VGTASWMVDRARGSAPEATSPAKGIKKAEGPIWPTAQRFVRRLSRPDYLAVGADLPHTTGSPLLRATPAVAFLAR
jgi:hypothetical protein